MSAPSKYPGLIASDLNSAASYTLYRSTYSTRRVLFFDADGNRFVVALYSTGGGGGGSVYLAVFKSVDSGESWTEQDPANRPSVSATSPGVTYPYGCDQVGSVLYIANGGTLAIDRFNMTTGLWMSRLASTGPTTDDCALWNGQGNYARCFPGGRADGSFVVLFQGEPTGSFDDRAGVVHWTPSGGWGSVQSPSSLTPSSGVKEYAAGLVMDANDVAHLFFVNDSTGDFQLYHRSFKTDNTLGTLQLVDPLFRLAGADEHISVGAPAIVSSVIYIPYYRYWVSGPVGVELAVVTAKIAVDPVWSAEVLPGTWKYTGSGQNYEPAFNPTSGFDRNVCALTALANGTTVRGVLWLFGTTGHYSPSAIFAGDFGGGWDWPRVMYNAYDMQTVQGAMVNDGRVGVLFESAPTALANTLGIFYVEADACDCSGGEGGGADQEIVGCRYAAT